jgi:hypothetical protein
MLGKLAGKGVIAMDERDKQIIVLGMHRSGTSTIARILAELGVNMGDQLLGATSSNPYGHYEDAEFFELNNRIFTDLGVDWNRPPTSETLGKVSAELKEEARALITAKSGLWGMKEPKTCFTIRIFGDFLTNPYFIVITRKAEDIAKSLNVRNGMELTEGVALTDSYNQAISEYLGGLDSDRILRLNYEELIDEPYKNIHKVVSFLNIRISEPTIRKLKTSLHTKTTMRRKKFVYLFGRGLRQPWLIPSFLKRRILK